MSSVTTMYQQQSPQLGILSPTTQSLGSRIPSQPLRRAVYIHVSDLISSYNIDNVKLEEELDRVKADRENIDNRPNRPHTGNYRIGSALLTTTGSCNESSTSMGGIPTELEARDPQKRLQAPRSGYNIVVLVGKVKVVVDKNRVDGSRVRLAEVEVGDETGVVSLRARDQQIDIFQPLSSTNGAVVLRNCTLDLYQGRHIRLAITKWGKLSRYPDNVPSTPPPPSKLNRDRNFSLIDLSKVASEMIPFSSLSIQSPSDLPHTYGKHNQQQHYMHNPDADHHSKQPIHQQQQLQQQRRNKTRGKQPNRKLQPSQQHQHSALVTNPSVGSTHLSGLQYQVIDHSMAGSSNIRYNPQPQAQVGMSTNPYGVTNVYSTHPHHHNVPSSSMYQQQQYQYHHSRQMPDNVATTGHTQQQHHHQQLLYQHQQQQQQQYELQQRHMQQLYQQQQLTPERGGVRTQITSQVVSQARTGPYNVQGPYVTGGAPVSRLGLGGSNEQYYQPHPSPHHQQPQQQQQQQPQQQHQAPPPLSQQPPQYPQQYMQQPRQGTVPTPIDMQTMLNPNDPNAYATMNPTATSYDPTTGRQSHHRKPTK